MARPEFHRRSWSVSTRLHSVLGVLIGSAIIGVLRNAMGLLGISSFLQGVVIGSIIILAVLIDRLRRMVGTSP